MQRRLPTAECRASLSATRPRRGLRHRRGPNAHGPHAWKALLALPVLFTLAACDLRCDREEVHTHYDAESDTLDVLLIYRGLCTEDQSPERIRKGLNAVRALLAGRREFMILNWPLHWNLDGIEEESDKALQNFDPDRSPEHRAAAQRYAQLTLDFLAGFSIDQRGLFLDEEGQLCGYQLLQVREVQKVVALGNELLSLHVLNDAAKENSETDDDLRPRTRSLMRAQAQSGEPWMTLDQHGFRLRFPLCVEDGNELRRVFFHGMADLGRDDASFVAAIAELSTAVRSIDFDNESFGISLGGPDPTRIDLILDDPEIAASTLFRDRLHEAGITLDAAMTLDKARALVR